MTTENVSFEGSDGQRLAAALDLPAGTPGSPHRFAMLSTASGSTVPTHRAAPRAVALFAHCFSCGKDLKSARRVTARLTDRGYAVLRFDFTGLGGSGGDFADTNFSSNVGDLLAAADWLRQTYAAPSLLIGHSLGGAAVLAAAGHLPEVDAVVTIGAPADPSHVTHLFGDALDEIDASGVARVSIAGRSFTVKQQFLEDIAQAQLATAVANLRVPLLVMHAPDDSIVSVANGHQLFDSASHPKSFVALDRADHLLSDPASGEYVADVIAAWAGPYLPAHLIGSDDVIVAAGEGEVVVAERGTGTYAQVVRVADRHVLLADEPLGIGDDTGPAPYDLLLAALGACTSMTLRMYADRKGWPLDDVAVRLTHQKVHASDCADCESTEGKVDLIHRELVLNGPLDDAQRAKLLDIADKCPVHRSLHDETHITTELV